MIILVTPKTLFVANIGDSRAIMSQDSGKKVSTISIDHKPSEPTEKTRIVNAGGKVYQSNAITNFQGKII